MRDIGKGKKALPFFARSRRHHFIPQFILRSFTGPANDLLYQLDIQSGKITQPGPKGAGWAPILYRVEDDQGRQNDYLEGFFSLVESHAAEAIRALHNNPLGLSEGDRANIAFFVALQDARTPAGQERMRHQLTAAGRMQLDVLLQNPREFEKVTRRGPGKGKSTSEIEGIRKRSLEQLRDGRLVVEATKELTLRAMLDTWLGQAGTIHGLSWKVLQAENAEFVLGDRPLTMVDPTPRFPWTGNGLISSDAAYSTLTLSPDVCLRLDQGDDYLALRRATRQVERTNLRSYGWAERYVFGRSEPVLRDLHDLAQREPDRVERPRASPQVVLEEADPNDPTVGADHPEGYPRGLWIADDDGGHRWCSYQLVDADAAPSGNATV